MSKIDVEKDNESINIQLTHEMPRVKVFHFFAARVFPHAVDAPPQGGTPTDDFGADTS